MVAIRKLSLFQKKIVRLLATRSSRFVLARSPVDGRVVHGVLLHVEKACELEKIALWRINKLINAGLVVPDEGSIHLSHELILRDGVAETYA